MTPTPSGRTRLLLDLSSQAILRYSLIRRPGLPTQRLQQYINGMKPIRRQPITLFHTNFEMDSPSIALLMKIPPALSSLLPGLPFLAKKGLRRLRDQEMERKHDPQDVTLIERADLCMAVLAWWSWFPWVHVRFYVFLRREPNQRNGTLSQRWESLGLILSTVTTFRSAGLINSPSALCLLEYLNNEWVGSCIP